MNGFFGIGLWIGLSEIVAIGLREAFLSLAVPETWIWKKIESGSFFGVDDLMKLKGDFKEGIKTIFVRNLCEDVLMILIFLLIDMIFGIGLILEFNEVIFVFIELLEALAIIF